LIIFVYLRRAWARTATTTDLSTRGHNRQQWFIPLFTTRYEFL